jgi:superfamily II RNA helicase
MILNGFQLSEFQTKAIEAIESGKHVLVTAHTGSGKTLPAEYAIDYFTKQGKNVIYTAPIKALSNQKYNEFTKKFPHLEVGIFTGDNKHNPKANVLIMTTEILQNKLFDPKASHLDFDIDNLGCVVFDEVHYIDDEDRGTVWEQSIILLPNTVQMVMLSATIGQKEEFAKWISRIKEREVVICETNVRVVPLHFYTFLTNTKKIVETTGDKSMKRMLEDQKSELCCFKNQDILFNELVIEQNKKCVNYIKKDPFSLSRKHVLNDLCGVLREREMFPALCFVFSRRQVEEMAKEISVSLFMEGEQDYEVEPVVRQLLVSRVKNWKEYMMLPEYHTYLDLLRKGIGIHHAGMLPIFREMIEILYDQKYIKMLFATETFAIGLNMPTKTVCFSSLYKHDGSRLRPLHSHEFTQMAGRAGRRNIDTIGHVILLTNLYEPLETSYYYKITNSGPKVLKSKFKIGYNLVLHHSDKFTKQEMIDFVNKSLMTKDILNEMSYAEEQIKVLIQKRDDIMIDKSIYQKYLKYKELEEQYTYAKNKHKIQLKKQMDAIMNESPTMSSKFEMIHNVNSLNQQIQEQHNNYDYAKNYVSAQISAIYKILEDNGFAEAETKCRISKNIHEIHPLATADILQMTNYFEYYSPSELFGFLSCFYDIKIQDDYKSLKPTKFHSDLEYLTQRFVYYGSKEVEYYLTPTGQDTMQYDMMDYVYEWMENCQDEMSSAGLLQKLKTEKNIFSGDFIKCCLKLVNISRELETTCADRLDFVEKLIQGRQMIMKFICTNESLYL